MDSDMPMEEEPPEMRHVSVRFFKFGGGPPQDGDPSPGSAIAEDSMASSNETSLISNEASSSAPRRRPSYASLSAVAINANSTLPNTEMANGIIGQTILPEMDSPRSFRPLERSVSLSMVESQLVSSYEPIAMQEDVRVSTIPAHSNEMHGFLSAADAEVAGGAAGEDRVQVIHSEGHDWLFCAIYDGFNGRDAADFLAGTLYDKISKNLAGFVNVPQRHESDDQQNEELVMDVEVLQDTQPTVQHEHQHHQHFYHANLRAKNPELPKAVLKAMKKALMESEADFMEIVHQEIETRSDLAMVGSCVLAMLLYEGYLCTMSVGDSRAVLATRSKDEEAGEGNGEGGAAEERLRCVQLTKLHSVADQSERERIEAEHPDDPECISLGRVKGQIAVTRAFGVGYLKKGDWNNKLFGRMRAENLKSPPYISVKPHLSARRLRKGDQFVVMGSDGLFELIEKDEMASLIEENKPLDIAQFLMCECLNRAARKAGNTVEYLRSVHAGIRRSYHDDLTIIVVRFPHDH
ncbi:hypothetical protein KP509_01G070600 [Ceratopteris richardii]|uniref:protein-serine/threonine phosphatase n=1 Tax=Ceratopteris richardii TaxID=49495 RepID=A0A8T2VMC2_CERRI|nr:hypothetical protein KP509_01G070600 [Ceratopteris richardii]